MKFILFFTLTIEQLDENFLYLESISGGGSGGSGTSGTSGTSGVSGPLPVSGWYTPTLTPITNIDSIASGTCTYIRVGSIVSCKVNFSIDATTTSIPTIFHVTFPISTLAINNSTIGSGIAIEAFGGTTSTALICSQETTTFACFFFPPTTNTYNGVVDIQYQGV